MHNRLLLSISAIILTLSAPSEVNAAGNIDVVRSFVNKGNNFMRARNFPEAIKQYEQALKEDPGNPVAKQNIAEAHNNWGIAFYGQRKFQEAMQEWNKCLELSPNHANARRNIAILNKIADQQGLDLNGAANESSPQKGDHPEDGKGKAAEIGKLKPRESPEEQTAGAVLILPSTNRSVAGTPPTETGTYETPAVSAPPSGVVSPAAVVKSNAPVVPASGTETAAPSWRVTPSSSLFPALPTQFVDTTSSARTGAVQNSSPPVGLVSPVVQQSSNGGQVFGPSGGRPAGNSLEDQLGAVEVKVYGQRQSDLTVIQRLEKMEKDTAGQVRSGTIVERIEFLKQNYGLR